MLAKHIFLILIAHQKASEYESVSASSAHDGWTCVSAEALGRLVPCVKAFARFNLISGDHLGKMEIFKKIYDLKLKIFDAKRLVFKPRASTNWFFFRKACISIIRKRPTLGDHLIKIKNFNSNAGSIFYINLKEIIKQYT